MDRTYVLFHPCWQCYDRRGVFCCLVSIVVDEHCHMVLPSACHGDFTFRVSSCLKTKINYDFHNLTKDTVELPTITDQKVTVNKHQISPSLSSLKILEGATKQDMLLYATLWFPKSNCNEICKA